jgi:transcriptional regulator with XRE-family HTH domain
VGFGTAVRSTRKDLGLTLEETAERAGVTPNYLGRIENEKVDPSLSVAIAVAKAVRVPLGELAERGPQRRGEDGRKKGRTFSSEAQELAALYDRMPLEIQERLLPLVQVFHHRLTRRRR